MANTAVMWLRYLLEHKLLILWTDRAWRGACSISSGGDPMTRENWQALVFGLILLVLCFVQ